MQPEIQKLVDQGALFVANHSGGKDSQVMLIELLKVVPAKQLLVVHASLGEVEWGGALELAERQAADAGLPFVVARAVTGFLEMVERRFDKRPDAPSWPSPKYRQCTSDLKRGPIEREVRRYAKQHGYTTIVNCTGLRAQESNSRAMAEPRTKYTDPDFRRNPKTKLFCYQCQKDLNPDSPYRMVFVVESMSARHPADVAGYTMGKNDFGWAPIGSDCARRLGLEWSVPKGEEK